MSISHFKKPGVYSYEGSYFAQKSEGEWQNLKDLAMQSGGYLLWRPADQDRS